LVSFSNYKFLKKYHKNKSDICFYANLSIAYFNFKMESIDTFLNIYTGWLSNHVNLSQYGIHGNLKSKKNKKNNSEIQTKKDYHHFLYLYYLLLSGRYLEQKVFDKLLVNIEKQIDKKLFSKNDDSLFVILHEAIFNFNYSFNSLSIHSEKMFSLLHWGRHSIWRKNKVFPPK
jgi:hypothetical protein